LLAGSMIRARRCHRPRKGDTKTTFAVAADCFVHKSQRNQMDVPPSRCEHWVVGWQGSGA